MNLALRVVSHSETGLVRKNNQDSGYASPRLLVVADGMGGAAAGDLASAVAVDTLRRVDPAQVTAGAPQGVGPVRGSAMLETMAAAVEDANDRIADLVAADVALDGMGTTVTAALFDGVELGLVHIGDSRAYLLRDDTLRRLTHDHSWVQSLVDEGRISEAEAAVHPHRSLLLRVLNGQPGAEAELSLLAVRAGDRLMFCSDGLCGLVDDPEIAELLARTDRAEALAGLVGAARAEGGVDNITVLVADVVESTSGPAGAPVDRSGSVDPVGAARGATDATVLGAAAERAVPPPAAHGVENEDTVVTRVVAPPLDEQVTPVPDVARAPAPGPTLPDESRYDPVPPGRRRFVRPLVTVVLVLVVVGAGLGAAYAWTRGQYYVGTAGAQVAIYSGVSEDVPGVRLSHVYELQDLQVADLPVYYQERVQGAIDVPSLDAARETVTELRDAATRCRRPTPSPTGGATTGTSPSATPSATPAPTGASGPSSVVPSATPSGPGC